MNEDQTNTKTVLIFGATGYIGNAVVAEAVRQGYKVVAVTRSIKDEHQFHGAEVVLADVSDPAAVAETFNRKADVVISCLATRSGLAQDFDAIDYQATMHILNAALESGIEKFILLSAICIRKPDLPLQLAKLKMEDELMRSGIDYTIVRPTAYFWVFDTQTSRIAKGWPGFLIGSGEQAVHNPIAREDLAEFMVDSITDEERRDRVFVIGGPETTDNIITYKDGLGMVFDALGKQPRFVRVPGWAMTGLVKLTWFIGLAVRKVGVLSEFLKIVQYYLENDMRAPGYGSITYKQHVLDTTKQLQS